MPLASVADKLVLDKFRREQFSNTQDLTARYSSEKGYGVEDIAEIPEFIMTTPIRPLVPSSTMDKLRPEVGYFSRPVMTYHYLLFPISVALILSHSSSQQPHVYGFPLA